MKDEENSPHGLKVHFITVTENTTDILSISQVS